ncbi:MAG: DUF1428 domain-containing protein [Kordiimonadaceae bacterium]|nr:DUF1428 domain-containing protein [Kordiimonadaceae bacterium]MBO6567821.1 DUF1428 domain-containing protein [Kordiimonadaceae bacterium]MBO6964449.1 DUF1428 domain-containing protein [Kordiimonadaceae bacterium]
MTYIDGFVAAVPTANKDKYRKHSALAAALFKKHGALTVIEGWGDDVPTGEVTDFRRAVHAQDDETVVFSYVVWPNKAFREDANPKVFADMEAAGEAMMNMPFDGKRLIYGGFEALVEL